MKDIQQVLRALDACGDSKIWCKYNDIVSLEQAWQQCKRGDWLLWLAHTLGVDKRKLILAKAKCAATVLHLMMYERSKKAVEVAIKYGVGEATEEELVAAYGYVTSRHTSLYADAAAAYVFFKDGYASATAVSAAWASESLGSDAWEANRKETADICREVLTESVLEKIKQL
jgi:hypothetical protein